MKRAANSEPGQSSKKRKGGAGGGSSRGARLAAFAKKATDSTSSSLPSPHAPPAKTRASTSVATSTARRTTGKKFAGSNQATAKGRQQPASAPLATLVCPRRVSVRGKTSASTSMHLSISTKAAGIGSNSVVIGKGDDVDKGGAQDFNNAVSTVVGEEAELLSTILSLGKQSEPPQAEGIPAKKRTENQPLVHPDASSPLEEMFEALEQVLPMFRRRRQATLFKQVKGAVECMCQRSFTRRHLAQIIFVQPDAYKLSRKADARPTRGGYIFRDLLIEHGPQQEKGEAAVLSSSQARHIERQDDPPILEEGVPVSGGNTPVNQRERSGRGAHASSSSCSSSSTGSNGSSERRDEGSGGMGSASVHRREVFRERLSAANARYCKCGSVGGVRSQRDGGSSSSSSECSCLPEAPLPDTSPLLVRRRMDRRDTGGDVAHSNAVANGVSMYDRGMLGSGRNPGDADGDGDEKDTPRDVDALRQRLREKDRKSAMENNKTREAKEADRRRKGNLPALADAVRSFFAHARRTTCSLDAVVDALSSSGRYALSSKEARERLQMLSSMVPEWCAITAPTSATRGKNNGVIPGSVSVHNEAIVGRSTGDGVRPARAKEVMRVNTRLSYREVRQMVVFMVENEMVSSMPVGISKDSNDDSAPCQSRVWPHVV